MNGIRSLSTLTGKPETLPLWRGLSATAGSALLLVLAFPTYSFFPLAWVALVPLILVCWRSGPARSGLYGFFFGFLVAHGVFQWMYPLPATQWYHCILLASFVAIYPALWSALLPMVRGASLAILFFIPASWVGLHYLKANVGFLSMPWGALAHSQHAFLPIVQIASITGEYGVTFLIILINTALAQYLVFRKLDNLIVTVVLLFGIISLGLWSLSEIPEDEPVTIATVQPARPIRTPNTGPGNIENLTILEQLTVESAKGHPDLIVWPESQLYKWQNDPMLASQVKAIAKRVNRPLVVGVTDIFKFYKKSPDDKESLGIKHQNSAFYVDSGGKVLGPYSKHILVPFAEYTPLQGKVKWPEWLVKESAGLAPGEKRVAFQFVDDMIAVPIICWENLFPDFVRKSLVDRGAVIVQLVNDSHFGESSASAQHNSASVFRAVENRTPVVISSNTGPSQIIDSHGRIVAQVPHLFEIGTAIGEIVPGYGRTFYNRHGDMFMLLVSAYMLLYLCLSMVKAIHNERS